MTKAEVIAEISYQTGQTKLEIAQTVNTLLDTIKNSVSDGQIIYLRGFGNFQTKHRSKRHARNIRKNTAIVVEAYDCPTFKPAKEFTKQVKKGVSND